MDTKKLIIKRLNEKGQVKASEIVRLSGFSRAYVNRFFRELRDEGVLVLVGKANKARYIPGSEKLVLKEKSSINSVYRILKNNGLDEDDVLTGLRNSTGIFRKIKNNVSGILEYAFTEMLNNAIEHSNSDKIEVRMERTDNNIMFEVRDRGIGIFNNIAKTKNLPNKTAAIQDLLKGKETTQPDLHSGEGIFFTSKVGDILVIESFEKKLIFDNLVGDIFLRDVKKAKPGTRVVFSVSLDSEKKIEEIFKKYTDDTFSFSKTEVTVRLYVGSANYVSRSQARRLLVGLEKFKTVILDFKGIDTIGQGFADEVFRVWKRNHPQKEIITKNAGENVVFMIKRAENTN